MTNGRAGRGAQVKDLATVAYRDSLQAVDYRGRELAPEWVPYPVFRIADLDQALAVNIDPLRKVSGADPSLSTDL